MARTSEYFFCTSSMPSWEKPQEYRSFAEEIFKQYEFRLIRFGALFLKKQIFGTQKGYSYTEKKKCFFDEIPMSDFELFHFSGTNEEKSKISNFELWFHLRHDEQLMYTMLVLENNGSSEEYLFQHSELLHRMIQKFSKIEYICADKMNFEKDALSFVLGIGHANYRNDYENEVAFSISGCRRGHFKLPYLFTYNYMKKETGALDHVPENILYEEQDGYVTIQLPRCFGKELEEYPLLPEWQAIYRELKTRGELVVTDKLGGMIEQVIEGNR